MLLCASTASSVAMFSIRANFFYERFKKLMEENFWKLYTAVSSCANPLVLEYKNKVYNKNMWRINFFERYSTFKETKQIKLATKHGMRHSIGPLRSYNEIQEQISKASMWIIQCLCHLHYCIWSARLKCFSLNRKKFSFICRQNYETKFTRGNMSITYGIFLIINRFIEYLQFINKHSIIVNYKNYCRLYLSNLRCFWFKGTFIFLVQ